MDDLRSQPVGAGEQADVDDAGDDDLGHVGGEIGRRRRGCGRLPERFLLDGEQRAVKIKQLAGKALPRSQLRDASPSLSPDIVGGERHRHHIFSRLTRNALNSGVRALASPTNGVSALASQ